MSRHIFGAATLSLLVGCTFGDEAGEAQPGVGPWFDENCVPVECLYECCNGWHYSEIPLLHGGQIIAKECGKLLQTNPSYLQYDTLMAQDWNFCVQDFADLEGGACTVINPPDVIKKLNPDGTRVYAGLAFLVCSPKGQPAVEPVQEVEFVSQK